MAMKSISTLKTYRQSLNISELQAAQTCQVPLRTYVRYEKDDAYGNFLKRKSIFEILKETFERTEIKGLLTLKEVIALSNQVFSSYRNKIEYAYLFGSYAKGYAKEDSDVDIMISTSLTGLDFVGLIEELREKLKKKVDLLRVQELDGNFDLTKEILKDGLKIYG